MMMCDGWKKKKKELKHKVHTWLKLFFFLPPLTCLVSFCHSMIILSVRRFGNPDSDSRRVVVEEERKIHRWETQKGSEPFRDSPFFVPSGFSPAFSSCSLTTSLMCFHWGSPSPNSWTLTSPSGLWPVLYLVILILTWSSAAWSGVTRQKKEGQIKRVHLKASQQGHKMEEVRVKNMEICGTDFT